ncbi:MAG TPA: flagellar type III secretion system pore protein FliP [Phycisphaerales bacterium]|nr:flagellar type III secretion system pore protein FliP [Phycisphaerales bacterium]
MSAPRRALILALALLAAVLFAGPARAQTVYGPPTPGAAAADRALPGLNPLEILGQAGDALPGRGVGQAGDASRPSGISTAMSVMLLLTVVALAPSIMLMTTCYMRIMIVLALLRQAIGAASIPPPQVLTSLSLFMTLLIMSPTLERVWDEAVAPYQRGEVADYGDLWARARQPMRDFMFGQLEATGNWSSLYMVLEHQGMDVSDPSKLVRADVSTPALVPAYMLSELKTAFIMGFKVYLPFLVIDMVIASLLISMSMMMLPPVLISLPFKLLLFVLVDGWTLVVGGLLYSFAPGAAEAGAAAIEAIHVFMPEAMRLALLR